MDQPQPMTKQRKATWRIGPRERTIAQRVLVVLICFILFVFLRPTFIHVVEVRDWQSCQTNVRKLALALQTYAEDFDKTLPVASSWTDAALGSMTATSGTGFKVSDLLHCPHDRTGAPSSYAFNGLLSGLSTSERAKDPEAESRRAAIRNINRVPLIFEKHGSQINASYFVRNYDEFSKLFMPRHELPALTGSVIWGDLQAGGLNTEELTERQGQSFLKKGAEVKQP